MSHPDQQATAVGGEALQGRYEILAPISSGAMGAVYRARDRESGQDVAIKRLLDVRHAARFEIEARLLASLSHPRVVKVVDHSSDEQGLYIVMELVKGTDLGVVLKKDGDPGLILGDAIEYERHACEALQYVHGQQIVHRDVKPQNMILSGDGVILVDFGVARMLGSDEDQGTVAVGTPRYMAPEQFEGTASPASDIYALGTIAYQALAGALPFNGATLPEFMVAKFAHAIPPIRQHNPEAYLPEALEALVALMLARDPMQRPNCDELFNQLSYIEQEVFGLSQSGPRSVNNTGPQQRLGMTGPYQPSHMPAPTTGVRSAPRLMEPSRVPPTIVAPLPGYGGGTMGMTPRPMSTSTPPSMMRPTDNGGSKAIIAAFLVLGLLGAGGIGAWAFNKSRIASAQSPLPSNTTTASNPVPVPTVTATPSADPTFSFVVESTPAGATVYEGETALGPTPLTVPIERTSVASGPRTFTVKKDGYAAATLVQGPSDDKQVKQMVTLTPDPRRSVHGTTPNPGSHPVNTARGDTDIRLNR